MSSSKAVYVDEYANISIRTDVQKHEPAMNELLIDVEYSGVNPADIRHATELGIRSTTLGYDFSGRVIEAPANSQYKTGDLVAGYTPTSIGRASRYGTHQAYIAAPQDMVFRVPSNLSPSHAASLSTVAMTAADVLYNIFKVPLPDASVIDGSPLLIWGASTSVGICALQFAKASGFRNILVTASPKRHELLKELGATYTFDYASSAALQNISQTLEKIGNGPIRYALDAVGSRGPDGSSETMLKAVEKSTICACVTRFDPPFRMPVAMTNMDFRIQPKGAQHPISIPARPEDHWRAWKALHWAIANYGSAFSLPNVEVFEVTAEEAIQTLQDVAESKRGFGKVVLRHPLN